MWSVAGRVAGGAILNVDSPEELDAIMVQFPFGPFNDVEIHALVDLHESLQRSKEAMQRVADRPVAPGSPTIPGGKGGQQSDPMGYRGSVGGQRCPSSTLVAMLLLSTPSRLGFLE